MHVGLKTAWSGLFRPVSVRVLVFFVDFSLRFGKLFQVTGDIESDQDRRVNETSCPENAWKIGCHAHALGRPRWRRRREVHKNVARQIAANKLSVSCHEKPRTPFEHLYGFHKVAVE